MAISSPSRLITIRETRSNPALIETNRIERIGTSGTSHSGRGDPAPSVTRRPTIPWTRSGAWPRRPACMVVGSMLQKRQQIDIATYIGSGKVEELKALVEAHEADVVVFDNDLGPAQTRNLERQLEVKVVDRTEVILDIFATHARTHEAHLQVELAQLEYAMPRLKRMWTHLSRYKGGIGVRGPGEKQLEEDRRLVGAPDPGAQGQARQDPGAQGARGRQPRRRADGLAGRLHQRRQEHAHERADRGRRSGRGQAVRHARHPHPPLAVPGRRAGPAVGHRRLHPRPAARAGRVVQGHARGGPPGRPAAARRRRLEPRGREADPGGQDACWPSSGWTTTRRSWC